MVSDPVQGNEVLLRRTCRVMVSQWSGITIGTGQKLDAIGKFLAEANVLKCHHICYTPERLLFLQTGGGGNLCCCVFFLCLLILLFCGVVVDGRVVFFNGRDSCSCGKRELWK